MTHSSSTTAESESTVVESSSEPDYAAVSVPAKSRTTYTYVERRAEILQLIEEAGHPRALNQRELADRYDVSQQQISKDLDRLDEYIRARIASRRDLKIETALDRSLRGLLEEGEYYQAAKVAKMLDEYLEGRIETLEFRRRLDRLEERAEADLGGSQ